MKAKAAPEMVQAVERGDIRISTAAELVDLPRLDSANSLRPKSP